MYKLIFSITVLLISLISLQGQSLSRTVIGSSGTYYDNVIVGDVHFTVGEVAILRLENGVAVEEGFHHANYRLFVSIKESLTEEWEVSIYPNPTRGYLVLDLPIDLIVDVQLYNDLGQVVLVKTKMRQKDQLQMEALANGTYWLKMSNETGNSKTFQVLKVGQ